MTITEKTHTPRMLAPLVAVVFISELALMIMLHYLSLELSTIQEALLDAFMLSTICSITFWFTVVKPMKAAATTEAEKFNRLLEAVPDGVIGVNESGQIQLLNGRIQKLFQYSRDKLIGKPIELLIPERFAESHVRHRTKYLGAPKLRSMSSGLDLWGRRADGSEFPVQISLNHVDTHEGLLVLCSVHDISDQKQAHEALREANHKLNLGISDVKQKSSELRRLSELGELLQGCVTEQEANTIISRVISRQLPGLSGGVYLTSSSRDILQLTSSWGDQAASLTPILAPEDCWALRRGRIHAAEDMQSTIQCNHINPEHEGYLCIPIMAQGEVLGILHVYVPLHDGESPDATREYTLESKRMLLIAVSEQIGLALANLRLREELRNQSIRDPLTGLFNRRFMEESLEREMLKALQNKRPLSLVTIDLDHFKRFNDSFGHEGGDLVLQEIGSLLREQIRVCDLACRLGGEELLVIFPETRIGVAAERAETIRRHIEEMTIILRGQPLGKITASFGVAEFPHHGTDHHQVLRAADLALYQAKADGRNRVVVAEEAQVPEFSAADPVDAMESVPVTLDGDAP